MAIKQLKLMADFETTTDKDDVRTWAVCAVDIDKLEVVVLGETIDDLMDYVKKANTVCYFHNLKFDGEFILHWLFTHGYRYSELLKDKSFRTLITDDGLFYSIEVCFKKISDKKYQKVTFYDSLKKLPFKVATIAKAFELNMSKGEIDYTAPRPRGYQMTEEEKDYIIRDCQIVAEALKIQMGKGLTKMTNASDAMNDLMSYMGGRKRFKKFFPELPLEMDADIRRAYKGGFVYLKPEYKGKDYLYGRQYDINSLYPYCMYDKVLPYGYPAYFETDEEYVEHIPEYPLYIVHIKVTFELKEGYLPTIQIKKGKFKDTEYLTTSRVMVGDHEENDPVQLWLTNVDFELFKEHYDVEFYEFDEGYLMNGHRFKGKKGFFKEYIDYWMNIKANSTGAMRALAKLMLNSSYGRFALNPMAYSKVPYLDKLTNTVRYRIVNSESSAKEMGVKPPEPRKPVYIPMGCFITAYAREKTIRSAQANFDRFIYADTDSLKLMGYEEPTGLEVHPTDLGAWKDEGNFERGKFLRAKTYMMTVDGKTKVTCAGMPDNVKEQVTFENFEVGATFWGKLTPHRYPGGIILEPGPFTISK